jgi:antitoxin MazE
MEGRIIQIGNSKGIRLPNILIRQYGFKDSIEMIPTPEGILIRPLEKRKAREGWADQIKAVIEEYGAEKSDSWGNIANDFDEKEWTW